MKLNKGSTLITVLITLLALSILATALISLIIQRLNLNISYVNMTGASYSAQAGIEDMKLNLQNRIESCKVNIKEEIQTYIDENYGKPGYDPVTFSRERTGFYIFETYLRNTDFNRLLNIRDSGYAIKKFEDSYFDEYNSTIDVYSDGTYGTTGVPAKKTVKARFKFNHKNEEFQLPVGNRMVQVPPYPLMISSSGNNDYSLSILNDRLDINGSVHLPGSIEDLSQNSDSTLDFSEDLIIDDSIVFNEEQQNITVGNDMMIDGNLQLGPASHITLTIERGNLTVNGNIIINGDHNNINVLKGSIYCSGNIIINIQHSGLKAKGQITEEYNVEMPQPSEYSFGNVEVFKNKDVINTGLVTDSLGTPNNPVIIFYDGDLTIQCNKNGQKLDIYGIIYTTGKLFIKGQNTNKVNIYGCAISGKKLEVDENLKVLEIDYDTSALYKLLQLYPEIISFFDTSQSNDDTGTVPVVNSFSIVSWDE